MAYQSTEITLKNSPEVARIIRAAAPNYKRHKARVIVTDSVTLSGTYWEGGSHSTYTAVDMVTGRSKGAPQYDPPQFGGPRTAPTVPTIENVAIVQTGTFCGKIAQACVYIHSANATKMLENK